MALKDKVFETLVLGGVTLLAEKGIGHVWDRLVPPKAPPPAPELYPAPPASSLGGYRVKVNEAEAEGLTAAIGRGVLSAFGVPTAAAPAAASFAARASLSAPDDAPPPPAKRRTCCADCRAGKPCCGVADSHAHVGSVDDPEDLDDGDDDFLSFAVNELGGVSQQIKGINDRVAAMRADYEKQLAVLEATGNKDSKESAKEIKRLQKVIEELSKAQAKAKRLPLMAPPAPSKTDKITELFEKYMAAQEARAAVPQAAPAPAAAQPIIVTAPWGQPAVAPPAPAPAPPAPNPYDMMAPNPYDMMAADPFANADLLAMLAVSGVDDVPAVGGVAAKPSPASPATPAMVNPFPSCGC